MEEAYFKVGGRLVSRDSEEGKELLKWEQPNYQPSKHPFPKMLYRADRRPDGVVSCGEADDGVFGGKPGAAEQFSARCQSVVRDASELAKAYEQGWRETPQAALEHRLARDKAVADEAARRHAADARMSEKAQAEAAKADAETPEHLPEVPEAPIRRGPGRPRRAEA